MKFINKIIFCISVFLLFLNPLFGKVDYLVEDQPIAFQEACIINHQGTLKQKENGFVYLDVSNEFITEVAKLLDITGELRTPPTSTRSVGAHISVFYENENILPAEIGESFSFEVKEIRSFTLHTRDGSKKLWTVATIAPELENLREKYNLSPKLKGYDFHITLGKQMPTALEGWQNIEILSPFNFSNEPTIDLETSGDFVSIDSDWIMPVVDAIEGVGQLKLKSNGFVYLDVNNRFIDEIYSLLPLQYEFDLISTKPKKMGAHISVIHEDEMIGKEIWFLEEAGQWFTFEVKEVRYVERKTPHGKERLWILAVDSPALQRLRTHLGLKPKLKGHDFHITIGHERLDEAHIVIEADAA